jgi:hypothetical protein
VGSDPDAVELQSADDLPPKNPRKFCRETHLPRLKPGVQLECRWLPHGEVEVIVDGCLWAKLKDGAKPAWSVGAATPGPCALPLDPEPKA